eukprot:TRINITY_DN11597_c0_g1_i1.p1 TRINITY_DN11597_c0_g1~~TRINITY_DN11597_c0_g1_i1.p1  ORF type:complete len:284 (+),score=38.40 TRINITY_DN11597_c0_g1_i1:352-1203(+)
MVHTLFCTTCSSPFVVSNIGRCTFHPSSALFHPGDRHGSYPCCGAKALRFGTSIHRRGCCSQHHTIKETADSHEIHQLLMKVVEIFSTSADSNIPIDDVGVEDQQVLERSCRFPCSYEGLEEDNDGDSDSSSDKDDDKNCIALAKAAKAHRPRHHSQQIHPSSRSWMILDDNRIEDSNRMESIIQMLLHQRKQESSEPISTVARPSTASSVKPTRSANGSYTAKRNTSKPTTPQNMSQNRPSTSLTRAARTYSPSLQGTRSPFRNISVTTMPPQRLTKSMERK